MLTGGAAQNGDVVTDVSVFDARTGQWHPAASLNVPRAVHSAIALRDGRILVAGGCNGLGNEDACMNGDAFVTSYEIYDPTRNRWQVTPLRGDHVRFDAALVQLSDGRVLALGGSVGDTLEPPPTLVWDGATWCAAPRLLGARFTPHAELLADGESVLVTGQTDNDGAPTAEVYRFAKGCRCKR
jgi:hypothetical protein